MYIKYIKMSKTDYKYLTEDEIIPNQRFALISFAEPLNKELLERRESFLAKEFITSYLNDRKEVEKYIKEKNGELTDDMKDYNEEEVNLKTINRLYNNFRKSHFNELNKRFNEKHNKKDEISISAFKIRGSYPTKEEATMRAKELSKKDEVFDIYTMDVGKWTPYLPPNVENIEDINYGDDMLNKIVKGNVTKKEKEDLDFHERKNKAIYKMTEETKRKKEELKKKEEEERKEILVLGDDDLSEDEVSDNEVDAAETVIGKSNVKVSKKSVKVNKKKFRRQNNRRRVNRRKR